MSVKETDDSTGETREKQDCFYAIMARWMTQMMKMMACDAKATCDIRNEVVMRQEALAEGMYQLMHGAPRLVDAEVLRPALEAQDAEE